LGMSDAWLALTPEQFRAYGSRMGVMHDTTGERPEPLAAFQRDDAYLRCVPAASGVGPARDLAQVAEMLLGKGRRGATAAPGEAANHRRTQPAISAIYGDLGIID